jgi:very-short-patch-repair endonuclease
MKARQFARALRKQPTDAERALWHRLRGRQITGVKFRRQVPIGPYIVDFASFCPRIVIELDGGQHAETEHRERDATRDAWLGERGFRVLRFWDNDVMTNLEGVLSVLLEVIRDSRSSQ